jgi:hypothetical protein
MGLVYEKQGEQWVMVWSCKKTGNVIGETRLGEVSNGNETGDVVGEG